MKLPKMNGDQDPVQVCATGRSGSGQDVDGDAMEFSKHGVECCQLLMGNLFSQRTIGTIKGCPISGDADKGF